MVKVKRINPEEDVTLEITAPRNVWVIVTNLVGATHHGTQGLYGLLDGEFRDRDYEKRGGAKLT